MSLESVVNANGGITLTYNPDRAPYNPRSFSTRIRKLAGSYLLAFNLAACGGDGPGPIAPDVDKDPPAGNFTRNPDRPAYGMPVQFTDNFSDKSPPINREWDFDGNGTIDSRDPNPTWVFPRQGTYNTSVKVSDSASNSRIETNPTIVDLNYEDLAKQVNQKFNYNATAAEVKWVLDQKLLATDQLLISRQRHPDVELGDPKMDGIHNISDLIQFERERKLQPSVQGAQLNSAAERADLDYNQRLEDVDLEGHVRLMLGSKSVLAIQLSDAVLQQVLSGSYGIEVRDTASGRKSPINGKNLAALVLDNGKDVYLVASGNSLWPVKQKLEGFRGHYTQALNVAFTEWPLELITKYNGGRDSQGNFKGSAPNFLPDSLKPKQLRVFPTAYINFRQGSGYEIEFGQCHNDILPTQTGGLYTFQNPDLAGGSNLYTLDTSSPDKIKQIVEDFRTGKIFAGYRHLYFFMDGIAHNISFPDENGIIVKSITNLDPYRPKNLRRDEICNESFSTIADEASDTDLPPIADNTLFSTTPSSFNPNKRVSYRGREFTVEALFLIGKFAFPSSRYDRSSNYAEDIYFLSNGKGYISLPSKRL